MPSLAPRPASHAGSGQVYLNPRGGGAAVRPVRPLGWPARAARRAGGGHVPAAGWRAWPAVPAVAGVTAVQRGNDMPAGDFDLLLERRTAMADAGCINDAFHALHLRLERTFAARRGWVPRAGLDGCAPVNLGNGNTPRSPRLPSWDAKPTAHQSWTGLHPLMPALLHNVSTFAADGRPVAMLMQSLEKPSVTELLDLRVFMAACGILVSVPREPSWWMPGQTHCVLLTSDRWTRGQAWREQPSGAPRS